MNKGVSYLGLTSINKITKFNYYVDNNLSIQYGGQNVYFELASPTILNYRTIYSHMDYPRDFYIDPCQLPNESSVGK